MTILRRSLTKAFCCVNQVGCDDSFNMVLDSDDVVSLPFIGSRIKEQALRIPSARQGTAAKEDIQADLFIQPVSIPKSINRQAKLCLMRNKTRQKAMCTRRC